MRIRAYQIDLARGQRGDVPYLKERVKRLAGYGYNLVMLYLEYRFKFPSHPLLAAPDSLTPEGVAELDAFSRGLDVDLVPQFNCCCHNEGLGLLEKYKHLVGDPAALTQGPVESLNPLADSTMEILRDIYGDLAPCFTSTYLHIGGDEIRRMRAFLPDATDEERTAAMFDFLDKVFDLVLGLGKIPMMWGDMLVKHPDMLGRVPEQVVIMDWNYTQPSKIESLRLLRDSGHKVVMAPATNTWMGHPARLLLARTNSGLVREARDEGVEGFCLCTWENDKGACEDFGWPVVMLASEIAAGNDAITDTIWQEYPKREWGVENARFGEYLELVERDIPSQFPYEPRGVKDDVIRQIRDRIMRTHNVGLLLWELVKGPFAKRYRDMARPLASRALSIAETFAEKAQKRKKEVELWVEATRLIVTMLDMGDEIENMATLYYEAAVCQDGDAEAFDAAMAEVCTSLRRMSDLIEPFRLWAEKMVAHHNQSDQEPWWPARARRDLQERAEALKERVAAGRPLLTFDRFLNDIPGVPTRVMWR